MGLSEASQEYCTRISQNPNLALFETDAARAAWLEKLLSAPSAKVPKNHSKSGYDVFVGIPWKEYYDAECHSFIILHNRETRVCSWFYTIQTDMLSVQKDHIYWVSDNHYMCDQMTDRKAVGVLKSVDYERFWRIYEEMEVVEGMRFVGGLLDRCVREGLLPGEEVGDAVTAALRQLKKYEEDSESDGV